MQRSDALNEWIAKHSTSEGLIEDLPNLSPSLKKELLREALELNIDIRQNYENRDGSVKAIRDQIALGSVLQNEGGVRKCQFGHSTVELHQYAVLQYLGQFKSFWRFHPEYPRTTLFP